MRKNPCDALAQPMHACAFAGKDSHCRATVFQQSGERIHPSLRPGNYPLLARFAR